MHACVRVLLVIYTCLDWLQNLYANSHMFTRTMFWTGKGVSYVQVCHSAIYNNKNILLHTNQLAETDVCLVPPIYYINKGIIVNKSLETEAERYITIKAELWLPSMAQICQRANAVNCFLFEKNVCPKILTPWR